MKSVKTLVISLLLCTVTAKASIDVGDVCQTCGVEQSNVSQDVKNKVTPLLKISASVDATKWNDEFMDAVVSLDLNRIKRALASGADINAKDTDNNETALFKLACEDGKCENNEKRLKIMTYLLENKADPNIRDSSQFTFLMSLAQSRDIDAIKLVLTPKYKADRASRDLMEETDGKTALLWTKIPIQSTEDLALTIKTLKTFKDAGVDINQKNLLGANYALLASRLTPSLDLYKDLKSIGVKLDEPDNSGSTVLMNASQWKSGFQLVKYLTEEIGSNINAVSDRKSVLDIAIDGDFKEIIDYLKSKGAKTAEELKAKK